MEITTIKGKICRCPAWHESVLFSALCFDLSIVAIKDSKKQVRQRKCQEKFAKYVIMSQFCGTCNAT
jgi:hypothetical protein